MHIKQHRVTKLIFTPIIKLFDYLGRTNPELLTRIRYFLRFRKALNLKDPKDLNEKIQWLKLKGDISKWGPLSDKYAVRQYVGDCGCGDQLVDLYGVWDDANAINFDDLPNSFVFKANNGCGSVILVKDKSVINKIEITRTLNSWIRVPYGADGGEIHYLTIKPRIIAEQLLLIDAKDSKVSSSIIDYKIWCINGSPEYIMACINRDKKGAEFSVYDKSWNSIDYAMKSTSTFSIAPIIPKPEALEKMLDIAKRLSQPFPCVRVDLYLTDGKVYFGEMTFTALGGMINYHTDRFLLEVGEKINLNYKA